MPRRRDSKRQSVADRRRNAKRALRAAKAGDVIAIGYTDGACNVLVYSGDSKEGSRMFRGWEPTFRKDRWGLPLWDLKPLHEMIGPIVSISWTAPGLPLHISVRRIFRVWQTFADKYREQEAAE